MQKEIISGKKKTKNEIIVEVGESREKRAKKGINESHRHKAIAQKQTALKQKTARLFSDRLAWMCMSKHASG